MEEREAVERLKQGNLVGMEYLVRAHQLRAVRAAYLITRDDAMAKDIVQQSFLRAVECIGQFDASRPFAPWFLRIVTNAAVKAAVQAAREVPLDEPRGVDAETLAEQLPADDPGPEAQLEDGEMRQALWSALGHLSPEDRAALVMRYYLGLSETDMAQAMHVAAGTVKWRLHQARKRLRRWLEGGPR